MEVRTGEISRSAGGRDLQLHRGPRASQEGRRTLLGMIMRSSTHRHPLYGEIPLIERKSAGRDGRVYTWLEYDPDFEPKLPHGAVRGDVGAQVLCCGHHVPRYFYVDEERVCRQCGASFVFAAREQKFWSLGHVAKPNRRISEMIAMLSPESTNAKCSSATESAAFRPR
jgi:Probable zinc-ribbon domain